MRPNPYALGGWGTFGALATRRRASRPEALRTYRSPLTLRREVDVVDRVDNLWYNDASRWADSPVLHIGI